MLSRHRRVAAWGLIAILGLSGCAGTRPPVEPTGPQGKVSRRTPAPPPAGAERGALVAVTPELGPPRRGSTGRVDWSPVAEYRATHTLPPVFSIADRDSLPAWRATAELPHLRAYALWRMGRMFADRGDTVRADSCLSESAARPSLWQWQVLRALTDGLMAREENARADSLLAVADLSGWPELDRAAWLSRRGWLWAALGDTAAAIGFCRQAIQRYPTLAPAAASLSVLEVLLTARRATLAVEDQRAAAEVEFWKPDREAAARRLKRALEQAEPADRWRIGLRLAQVERLLGRFSAGLGTLASAGAAAPSPADRSRCDLERARIHRDAGRADSAYAWFDIAAGGAPDSSLRETAWWESAQAAERAGAWSRARGSYRRIADLARGRASEAGLRVGLLWLAEGERDRAAAAWQPIGTEAARFWFAVARRGGRRAESDRALAALGALPGYDFYRAAARDSLGQRGWPGQVAEEEHRHDVRRQPGFELARDLIAIGARDDALWVLSRWAAGDPRIAGEAARHEPTELLAAARLAYAAGLFPSAIRFAIRARESAAPDDSSGLEWRLAPWAYPAAFDSLFASLPEAATSVSLDRALVQAQAWQESKFDPNARSRSDALGLLQLKLPAARDAARWLGEPAPTPAALVDPRRNFRYGVAYLRRLLHRFDGDRAAALSAYNAGPSRLPSRWREIVAHGGDALLAELAGSAETRDYVKRILGVRQAYRELSPSAGAP